MKILQILYLLIIGILFTACPSDLENFIYVSIENQSDENIYIGDGNLYMSTDDNGNPSYILYPSMFKIVLPDQSYTVMFWKGEFKDGNTANLLLIKESTIKDFLENETNLNLPADISYRYTYGELEAMNFKIIYTGE